MVLMSLSAALLVALCCHSCTCRHLQCHAWAPVTTRVPSSPRSLATTRHLVGDNRSRSSLSSSKDGDFFFAQSAETTTTTTSVSEASSEASSTSLPQEKSTPPQPLTSRDKDSAPTSSTFRRPLGSQELLMLPRQYGPSGDAIVFPSMNHVSVTLLDTCLADASLVHLDRAIEQALREHPLLRARIQGDGEPDKRIDLFQMVRSGEPSPLTFDSSSRSDDNARRFQASDIVTVVDTDDVTAAWQTAFRKDLDDGSWCTATVSGCGGPLWKLQVFRSTASDKNNNSGDDASSSEPPCALLLSFNHAISDQSSAHRLMDRLLRTVAELEAATGDNSSTATATVKSHPMPVALEDSVLGPQQRWADVTTDGITLNTLQYVAGKAAEGLKNPVILPDNNSNNDDSKNTMLGAASIIAGRTAGGDDTGSAARRSTVEFRTLDSATTTALVQECRRRGVSVSNALTAAVTLTVSDFIGDDEKKTPVKERYYKVLQSLDMRRFGAQLDDGSTVACMAGSHDLLHGPVTDHSGQAVRSDPTPQRLDDAWQWATEGQHQTTSFVETDGPQQAVRVFDFAMSIADLTNLVHLTGQSKDTQGRAYSAGVTNVGVYDRTLGFATPYTNDGKDNRPALQLQHGQYGIRNVFFATPHVTSGCLFPVSVLTVGEELQLTFHPVEPMVSTTTNRQFADAFVDLLTTMATGTAAAATTKGNNSSSGTATENSSAFQLPENTLPAAVAAVGLVSVLSHAGAWSNFIGSVLEMKANIADPADFWAALNFWIFFAVGHPILQPILWISDVLHGSPGPMVAGLVPATFLVGNVLAIAAFGLSKQIRNAVNIAALAAFFTYVGAGLDGAAGLGDFNLALDDSYKGQIVKGCPAYEDVRQPSMNDFNLEKYQGLWYEQKFHDWTQFKEVYDTTLGIQLTEGGLGWTDDFAVKGPAPDSAVLSWDKSPVANGAHYFLFGRVDPKDPPGILRESGFGVEFPNYIVDVKKDATTGEYTEAIQFQCLERGGVRVFEGINFMSRNPTMTSEEMTAMHGRAKNAGMYPYGADPDQMHTVARQPVDAPPIDNNWQAMWRAIGVDKLLELLTEAIEDGGR